MTFHTAAEAFLERQ